MYMTCHLSYALQGPPLFYHQIFFHMPQVNLAESRVQLWTAHADTRKFSFVTVWSCGQSVNSVIHSLRWNRQQQSCGGVESISSVKVSFQIEEPVPSWKWHGKQSTPNPFSFSESVFLGAYGLSTFFQITVDCIEGYPPISLQLGKHVFLSARDFYLASQS